MRGSLRKRSKRSWTIILDFGYVTDPETGKRKRKQQWIAFEGAKRQAEERLAELVHQKNRGEFVEPNKATFGEWLDVWVDTIMKPRLRLRTWEGYRSIINVHLKPALGDIRLQELTALHLDNYYKAKAEGSNGRKPLSQTTLEQHHVVISGALKRAMRKALVRTNAAQLVDNRPKRPEGIPQDVTNVWDGPEARAFLNAAREAGPQPAAFYALALDSGMRKGELCGLGWEHLDLEAGKLSVQRTLVRPGRPPVWGIPKNGKARVIHLSTETTALLKAHRKHQAEVKMKNRTAYHDLGLVFAKEWSDVGKQGDALGDPLQSNNLGQREFAQLTAKAKVKKIKFHGLRHTSATLLLKAGVPPKVVQERLGHKSIEITMNIYAHVLPGMQEDAAARLADILHG